jgi:hypothetical protein
MKAKVRKILRLAAWGGGALLLLLIASWTLLNVAAGAKLRQEVSLHRELGLALTLEDMPARGTGATGENSALLYQRAFALMERDEIAEKVSRAATLWTSFSNGGEAEGLEELLADEDLRQLIGYCLEAAELPVFDMGLDLAEGLSLLLPHLGKMRQLQHLVHAEAASRLRAGEDAAAAAAFEAALRMGEHVRQEPILISQLVAIAMVQHSISLLERGLVPLEEIPRETLTSIVEICSTPSVDQIIAAIDTERILFGSAVFQPLMNRRPTPSAEKEAILEEFYIVNAPAPLLLLIRPWLTLDYVWYLRAFRDFRDRFEQPYHEPSPDFVNPPRYAPLTHLLLPAVLPVRERFVIGETRRGLAATAASLELHRRATGSYPADLTQLPQEAVNFRPIDPCSGELFRYEPLNDSYRLYSVGLDREDHDGLATKDDRDSPGDIVWRRLPREPGE